MRISRIFCTNKLQPGIEVTLSSQAVNHVLHVLRLKLGASLTLFNGTGGEFSAELIAVNKNQAIAKVIEFKSRDIESPLKINLVQGIAKGEKMDYMIQKSTELGVHSITPIFTERCNVKLNQERAQKKQQHWQKIAISACEQCGRNHIPMVKSTTDFSAWLTQEHIGQGLVLHHLAAKTLKNISSEPTSCTILIGPEGGLTETEINKAEQHNFLPICLGPRILRTETAALVAITALQAKWGDLT